MFGMGFTEILFIAVIAVLFLGPDKLPEAMVQIAKFFKSVKSTVNEAKSSFEEEVHIKELREEALGYRKKIEEASHDISGFKNAIPNPAAELQDAITSIGGDRYLDDDLLNEIHAAEAEEEAPTPVTIDEPETTAKDKTPPVKPEAAPKTVSEKASKKTPGKKKSSQPKKRAKSETTAFKNLTPDEEA